MADTTADGIDLHIPPASIAAWCEGPDINCGNDEADIRAVAAPVVAAELRRIADEHHRSDERARTELVDARQAGRLRDSDMWFGRSVALEATVQMLRDRADELDPPATREA